MFSYYYFVFTVGVNFITLCDARWNYVKLVNDIEASVESVHSNAQIGR